MRTMRAAVLVASVLLYVPEVAGQCLSTIQSVELREFNANTSQPRQYTMCPNIVYNVGSYDIKDAGDFSGGDAFFKARSNLRVDCGPDGSSANNCTILGGNIHVALSTVLGMTEPGYNVVFSGFTFAETTRYSFWGNLPGSVTFDDCIFKDTTEANALILLDYFNSSANDELYVNFVKCKFLNNRYYGTPSYGALITGNGIQNRLNIQNSQFEDNDMLFNNSVPTRTSFLVETSGPLKVRLNCFTNNQVGVAPIGSYVADIDFEGNYGLNTTGSICPFIAAFETSIQFELFAPTCVDYDSTDMCLDDQTLTPTIAPSNYPSASPSLAPTNFPTIRPTTVAPSSSPTVTAEPTSSPAPSTESASPTETSEAPSMEPNNGSGANEICLVFSALAAVVISLWMF